MYDEEKAKALRGAMGSEELDKIFPIGGKHDRKVYERYFLSLPKAIRDKILKGTLQIMDVQYYDTIDMTGKKKETIFDKPTDVVVYGVSNLKGSQVTAEKPFLCIEAGIEYCETTTASDKKSIPFVPQNIPSEMLSGMLNLGADGKKSFELGLQVFNKPNNGNFTNAKNNFYELSNPKFIAPQVDVKGEINLVKAFEAPATGNSQYLRFTLYGIGVDSTGGSAFNEM